MRQCLKIVVSGKVQGVGYRKFVQKEASRLNVEGVVQNSDDGVVQILVCGFSSSLDDFIDCLYKGTKGSKVENLSVEPLNQIKDFRGVFRIIGVAEE